MLIIFKQQEGPLQLMKINAAHARCSKLAERGHQGDKDVGHYDGFGGWLSGADH